MTSITAVEVETTDALPTTAPHKVSTIRGKDKATVRFTPTAATAIKAWRIREGSSPTSGALVDSRGVLPGADLRPGAGKRPSDYTLASGTQVSVEIDDSQISPLLGDAEGGRTLYIWALAAEGWNA